eukprot:UN08724
MTKLPLSLRTLNVSCSGVVGLLQRDIFMNSKNLEKVDISGNDLWGALPELPVQLIYFNGSRNHFTGDIPKFPPNITTVELSYNKLKGDVPLIPESMQILNLFNNSIALAAHAFTP